MKIYKHTCATIAAATVALIASLSSAVNADTNSPSRKLTLSAYLNSPGSDALMKGDYATAVKKILNSPHLDQNVLSSQTNLCVAYTMTQQWEAAQSRCSAAVAEARVRDADDIYDRGKGRSARMAIAYSNRAVLNWLQNNPENALADMAKAHSIAPRTDLVTANWIALNGKSDKTTGTVIAAVQH